jgi:hypothetical protein
MVGMDLEHCSREGHDTSINTTNYHLMTTPSREWKLVVGDSPVSEQDRRFGRRIPNYKQLADLEVAKTARLTHAEIIAVVLYTGPMVSTPSKSTRSSPSWPMCSY